MSHLRVWAMLATLLTLGACHSYPYRYVAFSGDNIEVTKTGEPASIVVRHRGEPIPVGYSVIDPDVSLTLVIANEPYVPTFDVVSSRPIRAITFGTASALARGVPISTFCGTSLQCRVSLLTDKPGLPEIDEEVRLTIELDDRVEPISISGRVAESGHFYESVLYLY